MAIRFSHVPRSRAAIFKTRFSRANPLVAASLCVFLFAGATFCDAVFDVISMDGSSKVQRVGKKDWEKLVIGSQVNDPFRKF